MKSQLYKAVFNAAQKSRAAMNLSPLLCWGVIGKYHFCEGCEPGDYFMCPGCGVNTPYCRGASDSDLCDTCECSSQ